MRANILDLPFPKTKRAKRKAPIVKKLDAFFSISKRGSTVGREMRGGLVTFFTMGYIIVLNPIILSSGVDKFGHHLGVAALTTATCLIAAIMTAMMALGANLPLAIAAGLGLNGVLAFTIAPTMSWPDAMGLVVIEGVLICILVATGLRKAIMEAIPLPLKEAISAGIGLFIAFIGLVDSGFVTIPQSLATPVQLGATGQLSGWPVLVFCFGLLLMIVLMMKKVKGALLIGIVASTVLAVIVNSVAKVANWGTVTPSVPHHVFGAPNFGLIGHFSLFGGFAEAGVITAIVFIFTLFLSDFFDAMGTITGVSNQAGLLDKKGRLPVINKALFVDGLAAVAGGIGSGSSNTAFIESSSGVGEGARTGFASIITALLFVVALFLTPLTTIVPSQAATPALIIVGFLMMLQVRNVPWDDFEIALPAFLALILMPFTYSITNGIGAAVIAYVLLRTVNGKFMKTHWLLTAIAVLFIVYFFLSPIERLLGVA
ncbi:MAG TPA: NCS2 family permease [Candidatus Saccharimonadales bacterium]|nr:NCS2 family permease [Candidatus Saccharimonadales bacterium]